MAVLVLAAVALTAAALYLRQSVAQPASEMRVEIYSTGGEPVPVTKLEARQVRHRYPQFLPDGQRFLYYVQGTPNTQGIYLGSPNSLATKRLVAADTAGLYAPPGWLLFVRQGTLLAQRFDVVEDTLTIDPVTLADPVFSDQNAGAFR